MSSTSLPKTYKQASFKELGGDLVLEEVPLRLPAAGEILVKVEACGVCHSDVFAKYNAWGAGYPMVPGHEIIGKVAALGDGVSGWTVGDRIGGAWHGGHDGTCAQYVSPVRTCNHRNANAVQLPEWPLPVLRAVCGHWRD